MSPTDDIPLYAEVLTEAAETFFGARCEVDAMVETLERHVEKLKIRQARIEAAAGRLNFILIKGAAVGAFFTGLGVDPGPFARIAPSGAGWHQSLPFALTARGRYVKLIGEAYADLVLACDQYMKGPAQGKKTGKKGEAQVYYGLLVGMVAVINAEIRRVNQTLSPCQSLRFAKQFTATCHEAQVPDCHYGECLEEKLGLSPVDLGTFDLAVYPPLDTVAGKIDAFGKALYRDHAEAINRILSVLGKTSKKR